MRTAVNTVPPPVLRAATAAENVALTAELARYQQYVDRGEREALLSDVEALRAETLRLSDTVQRLSAVPQVHTNIPIQPVMLPCVYFSCRRSRSRAESPAEVVLPPLSAERACASGRICAAPAAIHVSPTSAGRKSSELWKLDIEPTQYLACGGVRMQVREIEAVALKAAHDGALQIENALAAAQDKVKHQTARCLTSLERRVICLVLGLPQSV